MSFARNIIRDLVERRLWPVAVLMVVAIVAIPMLLGGGASSTGAGEDSLPATPDTASTSSAVELLGPPSVRKRPGKVVDPFRRAKKKADSVTAAAETTEPTAGATAPSGGTPAPETGTDPATPQPSKSVYRTTVRWSTGDPSKARRISRLTPLGGLLNPAVIYLGVEPGGKHALFLLGPDATSVGEGACREASCRVFALRSGEKQIIDLQRDGSQPTQFELDLVSVSRHEYSTAAKAVAARGRVHPDGRDVLRSIFDDGPTALAIGGFGYDRLRGVMLHADTTPTP